MKDLKIAISGNIGVGKSTLCKKLNESLDNSEVFKENVDKTLLKLFYDNVRDERLELTSQLHFLNETLKREILSYYSDSYYKIYDRPLHENVGIFAKQNLNEYSYIHYLAHLNDMKTRLKFEPYDLQFILTCNITELCSRIRKRNRSEENDIDPDYLKDLNDLYKNKEFEFLSRQYSKRIIHINVTEKTEDEVLEEVLEYIEDLHDIEEGKIALKNTDEILGINKSFDPYQKQFLAVDISDYIETLNETISQMSNIVNPDEIDTLVYLRDSLKGNLKELKNE